MIIDYNSQAGGRRRAAGVGGGQEKEDKGKEKEAVT